MGLFRFFFGNSNKDRKDRDSWRPSVIAKNAISPINKYGTCFGCQGTGRFERPALPCFSCEGTGQKFGQQCRRCNGSGNFKSAVSDACRKCDGSGWHKNRR